MAGIPMIVSSRAFGAPMATPQLPTGERVLGAELAAVRQEAVAGREADSQVAQALSLSAQVDAQGAARLGNAVAAIGYTVAGAVRSAQKHAAKTDYLKQVAELEEATRNSPDYEKATQTFEERRSQIEGETLGRLWFADRDTAQAETLGFTLQAQRRVQAHVASKSSDAWKAADNKGLPATMQSAADAGSPLERERIIADYDAGVQGGVAAGHITAVEGAARSKNFRRNVEITDAMRWTQRDPARLMEDLKDPAKYTSLTPEERQSYQQSAQNAHDQRQTLRAGDAAKNDVAVAAATYMHRFPADRVPALVDRGLIPQESGNNPSAESPKGAAGLTQFMPGTARMVAQQMGLDVFSGETDAGVRGILKANPAMARDMAIFHVRDLLKRYNGSLPAALAAYNAGPGNAEKPRADAWHKAAIEAFGPEYTAAQFASIVDVKETQNYVLSVYRRFGADPGRGGISANASYRAQAAVQGVIDEERSGQKALAREMVSDQSEARSTAAQMFRDGVMVAPEEMQRLRAPLELAASLGDGNAAVELRKLREAEALGPLIQQAWRMTPQERETEIAGLRAQQAAGVAGTQQYRTTTALETVHKRANELRESDPVRLAELTGAAPAVALPPPEAAAGADFLRPMTMRMIAAGRAMERFGAAPMPLKAAEAQAYKQAWAEMTPERRAALLGDVRQTAEVSGAPHPDALVAGFVRQVAGKSGAATVAAVVSARDPGAAADILRGQALLNTEGYAAKKADITGALHAAIPAKLFPPEILNDVVEASLAIYASDRAAAGKLFEASDRAGIEAAVARIAGKPVSWNGEKALVPPALESKLREVWSVLDPGKIGAAGYDAGFIRDNARLVPAGLGDGRYYLMLKRGKEDAPLLSTAPGEPATPVIFDVNRHWTAHQPELAQRSLKQSPEEYWQRGRSGKGRGLFDPTGDYGGRP